MPRVVHFEIHAKKPERAIRFYTELFQWQFTKWTGPDDYWLIKTGDSSTLGIDGGLVPRQEPLDGQAVIAYVSTIDVANLDRTMDDIVRLGGTITVPRTAIPHVGWLAYAKDPEGNLFGIMQMDPGTK
jgi:predicted enzyme related to lactoylglutathione lyase